MSRGGTCHTATMRKFNTEGPVRPHKHYCIPPPDRPTFFREHSEHWLGRFDYAEAGPQLCCSRSCNVW